MKCVIIIDEDLPLGLIANTAAVLSLSLGHKIENLIGHDLKDSEGNQHVGITTTPIPILKGDSSTIKTIRHKLFENAFDDVFVVDFCNVAQETKTYDDYSARLENMPIEKLLYLGIAMYGPKKKVNQLTGNMGLLK
jgi:hypothetical protein